MIGKLIHWCAHNRGLVLLLTAFLLAAGAWSAWHITVDAIPDLSDVQVVIRTDYAGQAPQIVEDQVTYPLTTAMLAVPYAKVVRGYSMFGASFVYIIFEDGTDLYWARSRVLEQLSAVSGRLPAGVTPQLGPDATGVGWVYEYVLTTGPYCPDHPNGAWHDAKTGAWYAESADAPPADRPNLVHRRVFDESTKTCPLDGRPLVRSDQSLADLRSIQDWYLRYELTAVEGVSEIAPIGGFVKQYQVVVDPVKLLAYHMPLSKVKMAIRQSNRDVGGRVIEQSETEYMVRGLGYLGTLSDREITAARSAGVSIERARTERVLADLRKVSLGATASGSPIYLGDVADVRTGPEIRRGVAEWDGRGEAVGGIVVMRFGENARATIRRVREKLDDLERGLPGGIGVEVAYDRSDLIERSIRTLTGTLTEEILVVSLVIILFLLHARSALVAAFVLPTGVLATLAIMNVLGINANIMSLGGIAISIGVMVDSSIVMVENAHKHLEREAERLAGGGEPRPRVAVIAEAAAEVGPTLFFSLLIITASFLPIFVLGEQSGRLFKPLAWTKTFAMAAAAFLAVTVIPVLMIYFIRERMLPRGLPRPLAIVLHLLIILLPAAVLAVVPLPRLAAHRGWLVGGWALLAALAVLPQRIVTEHRNPLSWLLQKLYHPAFAFVMKFRFATLVAAFALMASIAYPIRHLGSEFMPPLAEGDLLYMPTTNPGISVDKARELLGQTDAIIRQFPEVESVFGKAGRADTATDPAPPSMLETTITLRRDKRQWRQVPIEPFYRDWPAPVRGLLSRLWPADRTRPITVDELVYGYRLPGGINVPGLNQAIQIPGLTNAWTMPIKTRIDMLSTGIKTPVGVKVMGKDLATLADLARQIADVVKTDASTGRYTTSAFPEKSVGGRYFDVRIDRDEIARYGLSVGEVQDVLMSATGGMNVTETVEGLERYPVNARYPQELRDSADALRQTLVATPGGAQVPLGQLAEIRVHEGPPMVKSENARLTAWVYVDIAGIDVGAYVANARKAVEQRVTLPAGYNVVWSGQYEYMQAARARLRIAIPAAGVIILLLLYLATRSWLRVIIVLTAVPFSLVGAMWFMQWLDWTQLFGDFNFSLAVWVGLIALAGLDAETGLVMLLYLDNSYERFRATGRMRTSDDLWDAIHEGAVQRIRPKTMTVMTTFIGLVPLLWAAGAGADTMRRLAVPMIGGLATSFVMELMVYPVIFATAKEFSEHTGWSEGRVTALLLLTLGLGLFFMVAYNWAARRRHRALRA